MYVILTYDIKGRKVKKIHNICRKYLFHIQKSVFEGNITTAKLSKLENLLLKLIDTDKDSINIYKMNNTKYCDKKQIGINKTITNIIKYELIKDQ